MKKMMLLITDLKSTLLNQQSVIIVTTIFLILSITVSFSMVLYTLNEIDGAKELDYDKRTYEISSVIIPEKEYENNTLLPSASALKALLYSRNYPSISEINIGSFFCYKNYSSDKKNCTLFESVPWYVYFNGMNADIAYGGLDVIFKDNVEGEIINEENGYSSVAILSRKNFPEMKVGDSFELLGKEIKIIGTTESLNIIPFFLIKELSEKEQGFYTTGINITFENELNNEQKQELLSFGGLKIISRFAQRKDYWISYFFMVFLLTGGIFIIVVVNVLALMKHIIYNNRYKFIIMKICGADNKTLCIGILSLPLIIVVCAFVVSALIHRFFIEPRVMKILQYGQLNFAGYIVIVIWLLIICSIALIPTLIKVLKAAPSDNAMER